MTTITRDVDNIDPLPLFAVLDYIPLVSSVSGVARTIFGTIETAVGIVAFPFQLLGRAVFPPTPFFLNTGIANIVRGVIAGHPIIGNIVIYLYDHSQNTRMDIRRAAGLSF